MKYADLIHFDPIETVVQLRDADQEASARRLVETFVISDRMAEQFEDLVIPQLQFAAPADNKGLMVVGNYGTGKSHLMAVISAVAEHAELASSLTNPAARESATALAGRFRVIRSEIGSTTMSLREIIAAVLEDGLSEMGVNFTFPELSERHENKSSFVEMMAAFEACYPERGLLLVIDELLDYLRTRKDQELSLDLSFLREVGEVCKGTRFRFICGVQESIFDNPRFQFVADTLRRVKDRFEQVRIAREDVAHVVSERLLRKTAEQRALIREHLTPFAPLYGSMNERMDDFVRLFPVHPAYLETFERVYVAEKREVLKTLSASIRRILDEDVPEAQPGLIAYDSYWQHLKDNPSFRSVPEIREVIEKSDVLEGRVQHAFTRPQYRPAAIRVIQALSVHRLTTGDIYAPLGPTAEELRDDLCLMLPIPERDAEFLKTVVETVLREIVKTVSGQFISLNRENGQYFLDLKKDIDFDSLIERKGESLDDAQLDRYYFDALRRVVLEDPDAAPYVSGFRIWEHELLWRERMAGRSGYLFFGAPNERSTAQPPRDFYLYFVQPFDEPYFKDERKPDEVFFRLRRPDDDFLRTLRLYAGAREQAATASGGNKRVYEDKALGLLRELTHWLQKNLPSACEVVHEGRERTLGEILQAASARASTRGSVKDQVDLAGATCLAPHFADKAPDYPTFGVTITRDNRQQAAQEALRWIAGSVKSKPGTAVLDALELLDGDQLRPRESRYARHVTELLGQKGQGQVLNQAELIQDEAGIPYWTRFRLEPEFLGVVLAALVHSGDLLLSITGQKLDAASVGQFARLSIDDVARFKHVGRPRDLPLGPLQELCDLLEVPRGLVVNPGTQEEAVKELQRRVAEEVNRAVVAQAKACELVLWGQVILTERERTDWSRRLGEFKTFLESLQALNTVGKLKNFKHDADAVHAQRPGLQLVRDVEELQGLVQQVGPITSYLGKAEAVLEAGHPWVEQVRERRGELMTKITSPKHRADAGFQRTLTRALAELKGQYRDAYLDAHGKARLGPTDDRRVGRLKQDPRLRQLQQLASVEMMPAQQLRDFENRLLGLKTCIQLTKQDLEADPICPHCAFRPVEEPAVAGPTSGIAADLDDRLDDLVRDWTNTLIANLEDPTVAGNIDLLTNPDGKQAVLDFLERRVLPDPVEPALEQALQDVLSGLEKVVLSEASLRAALARGGIPCRVKDLRDRFEEHIASLTKGRDPDRVRIVLED